MALTASEHPAKVTSYEVKHRRGFERLALFGAVAFVCAGLWMLLDAETGMAEKGAGALAIAFFGWCAVVIVQRMKRGAGVTLSHEGIHYAFAPNYQTRKVVPWRDVEGFGVGREQSSEFNFVRLASYGALVGQFSDSEAAQTMQSFRGVMRFAGAAAIVAGANLKFGKAAKAVGLVRGGGAVASLSDMLRFNREKFGGEICLGWPDRDRSATQFQELLAAWKDYCSK